MNSIVEQVRDLTLPADTTAPGAARTHVAARTEYASVHVRETAVLIVSELVTNAVVHGRPDITLSIIIFSDGLRIEVHDQGSAMPARPVESPNPRQAGGRGLVLVDALATRWGVTATRPSPGKTVWFELAR